MNIGTLTIEMAANIARLQTDMAQAKQVVSDASKQMQYAADLARKALVALVGIGSVAAFKGMIDSNIAAMASLKNLSTMTGVAVEQLSGLGAVARISGTSLDSVAGAMNKLSKGMAGATEDSKGVSQAVQALGINFDTFAKMSPDQRMQAVAKAMEGFADGSGKTAAAMLLFGEAGADMLPMLKDLAAVGELQAKVTTEQAERAKDYEVNLKKIKASGEAWKKELAMGMLPAMQEVSKAVLDMVNGNTGLRDSVRSLAADGTLAAWVRGAVVGLSYIIDVAQGLLSIIPMIGKALAGMAAATSITFGSIFDAFTQLKAGNLSGAWDSLKSGIAGVKSVVVSAADDISDIWGQKLLGQKFRERLEDAQKAVYGASSNKPQVDIAAQVKADKTTAEKISEYDKLIAKIKEKTAVTDLELTQDAALSAGQKFAIEVLSQLTNGKLNLTTVQKQGLSSMLEEMLASEQAAESHKRMTKATFDAAEAHTKYLQTIDAANTKLADEIDKQKLANDEIGLSKTAVSELVQAREEQRANLIELQAIKALDRNGDEITYNLLKREAAAVRELASLKQQGVVKQAMVDEAKQADAAWTKFYDSLYNGLTDSLYRAFEQGKGFFETLWNGIKNLFKTTVLKMTIQGVVGGVSGYLGLPGSAQAANGMGGLNGSIGAGIQLATGASAGASAASLAYANGVGALGGDGLGALIAANGGWAGVSTGVGTAGAGAAAGSMATIGAAMPYIAAAVLAYSLLSNDSTKPSIEGGYSNGIDPGTNGRAYVNGLYGGALDTNAKAVVDALSATYADIVKVTGKQAADLTAYQFTGLDQNGHQSAVDMAAYVNGSMVYNRYSDLGTNKAGMSDAEVQAAVGLATEKSLVAALKATDLGDKINSYLAGITVEGKTLTEIDAVIAQVKDMTAALQAVATQTDTAAIATQAQADATKAATAAAAAAAKAQADAQAAYAKAVADAKAGLDRAVAAERASIQTTIDAKAASMAALQSVFDLLKTSVTSLYGQVSSTALQSAAQGRAFISTALALAKAGGVMPDGTALSEAITAVRGGIDGTSYTSAADEAAAKLQLAGELAQLQDSAGVQLSTAQRQLAAAQSQLKDLDELVNQAQAQIDAINGVDSSVKSVAAALDALTALLSPAKRAIATSTASIAGGAAVFGGTPTVGPVGDPYTYNPADFGGMSEADYKKSVSGILAALGGGVPSFDVGTNYVPRDMLAQIHQGEAIVPKAYNPAAGGTPATSGDLAAAMDAMRVEVRTAVEAVALNTSRLDRRFELITEPGNSGIPALNVRTVAA